MGVHRTVCIIVMVIAMVLAFVFGLLVADLGSASI